VYPIWKFDTGNALSFEKAPLEMILKWNLPVSILVIATMEQYFLLHFLMVKGSPIQFPHVEHIQFHQHFRVLRVLRLFPNLKRLSILSFKYDRIASLSLREIGKLKSLEMIELKGTRYHPEISSYFQSLDNLKELRIHCELNPSAWYNFTMMKMLIPSLTTVKAVDIFSINSLDYDILLHQVRVSFERQGLDISFERCVSHVQHNECVIS